jgi:6-phosphogluconolactonase
MSPFAEGEFPWSVTVDPTGRYVYVTNFNGNSVSAFTIGAGGRLSATGTIASGTGPFAMAVTN